MSDHISAARTAIREYGLDDSDFKLGELIRCKDGQDRGTKKTGWYNVHEWVSPATGSRYCFGTYGTWRRPFDWETITPSGVAKEDNENLKRERERTKLEQDKRDAKARRDAILRAEQLWENAQDGAESEYLNNKHVGAYGLKSMKGIIMVPAWRAGTLRGIQYIAPDGRKTFLKGTDKRGSCHVIHGSSDTIAICEGYATAATVHEATGWTTVVAFDAGNLKPVCKEVRSQYPGREMVIAADDDHEAKRNAGLTYANRCGCKVLVPRFTEPTGKTDWNDLLIESNLDLVRDQLLSQLRGTDEKPVETVSRPCTDLGNAERLAAVWSGKTHYSVAEKTFRYWDGRRWATDDSMQAERDAQAMVRNIRNEAINLPREQADQIWKWATRSEAKERLKAAVEVAKSQPGIPVPSSVWDSDDDALCCQNGVVDLKTGDIRPHRKSDYITRITPVDYNPYAVDQKWLDYLDFCCNGDQELVDFLQRAAGYSLTGHACEEILLFLHGRGGTGKTSFLEAISSALGRDYCKTVPAEILLKKPTNGGSATPELASLRGVRLLKCSEMDHGKEAAEGLIKSMTGGEMISARALYSAPIEFIPKFTLWIAANHAPRVNADDSGLWRRIMRIGMDREVPVNKRDPHLKRHLKTTAREAVLNWMIQGAIRWYTAGVMAPDAVTQATEEYRKSSDPLAMFFDEQIEFSPATATPWHTIWNAYREHAHEIGTPEKYMVTPRRIQDRLKLNGAKPTRTKHARLWHGVMIKED